MPRRPPAYERRERWMTVISASFHPTTIFRFVRMRAMQASDLRDKLAEEIVNLDMRLKTLLPVRRLLKFWEWMHRLLKGLEEDYLTILHRLARSEWTWWQMKDKAQQPSMRAEKESMIKSLVVDDWLLSILQNAVESSFQKHRPWFLDSQTERRSIDTMQRRFSHHDSGGYTPAEIYEIAVTEVCMTRWTKSLEEQLLTSINHLEVQYNEGKVFEHFTYHVQWTNEEEQRDWEQMEIEWPYPDCFLKVEDLDTPESKALERHAPIDGVSTWQEDKKLRSIFS